MTKLISSNAVKLLSVWRLF